MSGTQVTLVMLSQSELLFLPQVSHIFGHKAVGRWSNFKIEPWAETCIEQRESLRQVDELGV